MKRHIIVLALIGLGLGLSGISAAQEKYTARLMTRGGPNSEPAIKIQMAIDSYTTGQEAWELQRILEFGGYEPFLTAFRQSSKGIVAFSGTRGLKITINVAHVIPQENGRKIMLFAEKQPWETDVMWRVDARFPFMVIELNVNNKGKGEGKVYENAQVKLNGDRASGTATMEMESYNSTPKILFGVQLVK